MEEKPTRRQRFRNWADRNSEIIFGTFMVSVFGATVVAIDKISKYKLPMHADIWTNDDDDRAMFITSRDGTLTRLDYNRTTTDEEV